MHQSIESAETGAEVTGRAGKGLEPPPETGLHREAEPVEVTNASETGVGRSRVPGEPGSMKKDLAGSSRVRPGRVRAAMCHKESRGENQAGLADCSTDDDLKARLFGGMCGSAQLRKGRPNHDGANGVHLLKESAGECWGELKRMAGRVSTSRVSQRIWGGV